MWQIDIQDERGRLLCTSRLTMAVLKHKQDKGLQRGVICNNAPVVQNKQAMVARSP